MEFIFHRGYALATLIIFLIEVVIALFVRDAFIRPYGGDILAVILVYLGFRAVTNLNINKAVGAALGVAFAVELAQALNLITTLGLADNKLASVVLGTSFAWGDIAAYIAGAIAVLLIERWRGAE